MKKIIALLMVLCLVFGFAACAAEEEAAEETPAATPAAETEEHKHETIDFEVLYNLYDADTLVMTIDGKDVTWGEYFYMLYANAQEVLNEFEFYHTYYGMEMSFATSMSDDPEDTYAAYVVDSIDQYLMQLKAIVGFGEKNGVEISQELIDGLDAQRKADMETLCGEGATEEEFEEHLKKIYLTRKMYDEMNLVNVYYQENFNQLYGENGANISDSEAMAYLKDGGYMRADHILFMTVDGAYQPLDEATVAEKKAQAESAAEELASIKDEDERIARFYELKEQYTEDTGAAYYTEGYTFTPGTMVSSFENGHNELKDNEISGVIESEYGYHILLRLPLDPDATIDFSDAGTALSARGMLANSKYGEALQAYHDGLEAVHAEDFEKPNLLDYIIVE